MPENEITIEVNLDTGNLVRESKAAEDRVKELGEAAEESGTGFSKLQAQIVTVGGALTIAQAAVGAISGAFSQLGDVIDLGGEVSAVNDAFVSLQGGTSAAEASLDSLRQATGGLVSDLELQRQANQAVALGLPIDEFDELTEAAIKLGRATGQDAVSSIESLVSGLGRGSTELLDNLGIVLRASDAQEQYAQQLGITVDALTEAQKAQAVRVIGTQAAIDKAAELDDAEENSATALQKLRVEVENAAERFAKFLIESDTLKDSIDFLTDSFKATVSVASQLADIRIPTLEDFGVPERFAEALRGVSDSFATMAVDVNNANPILAAFSNAINTSELSVKELRKELNELASFVGEGSTVVQGLTTFAEQLQNIGQAALEASQTDQFIAEAAELAGVTEEVIRGLIEEANASNTLDQALKKLGLSQAALNKAASEKAKIAREQEKLDKAAARTAATKLREQEREARSLAKIIQSTTEFKEIGEELLEGTIELSEAKQRLLVLYQDTAEAADFAARSNADLTGGILDLANGVDGAADNFTNAAAKNAEFAAANEDAANSQKKTNAELEQFGQTLQSIDVEGNFGNFLDGIGQIASGDIAGGIGSIGDSIIEGFGLGDTEEATSGIGAAIGGVIGGIIGTFLGGNTAIGAAVGSVLGDLTETILQGTKSAFAAAIDSIDAFFEDALDANRVQVIIDGQLVEIRDILENDFQGFFENLDLGTQEGLAAFEGFEAIGNSIVGLLDFGDDLEGNQIGAVLGNQLQNLNNLQLLLQRLEIDAEDLGEALRQAYTDGDISARDFFEQSAQIENIYKKGIPDGVGLTDRAFQNLIESGGVGSLVLDSLIDLSAEASEAGITSLEELRQSLLDSGADAEKVSAVFDSIADAGVTSLEQLADISIDTAARIAVPLEDLDDFFQEQVRNINQLKEDLEGLQDQEVDVTLNVNTNLDNNTRDILDAGVEIEGGEGLGLV